MDRQSNAQSFLDRLGIRKKDVVCLVGAGGKTSLMFRLAIEARSKGLRVLVTTSTRIFIPEPGQYDQLDLSGAVFADREITTAGIYVAGLPETEMGKMRGVRDDLLDYQRKRFDLVLIEADGAANKPLKGWKENEPVLPEFTSLTVGVVDIQTIGRLVEERLVHRLELFTRVSGAEEGEQMTLGHLLRLIVHQEGLFGQALGREALFVNKVERDQDYVNLNKLRQQLDNLMVVAGSVQEQTHA